MPPAPGLSRTAFLTSPMSRSASESHKRAPPEPEMPDQASMASTAYMVNGFDPGTIDDLEPDLRQHVARRLDVLGPAYKLFYRHPVRFVRAEGVHLYDADGQAYLDAYNNVPSVGHCHPHVVEAIARQAATLNVHTRYGTDLLLEYAERLAATFPGEINNVMFTCTGSEAVDLALRVARVAPRASRSEEHTSE